MYRTDLHFMDVLGKASITNYSFGAPRVGNDAFRTVREKGRVKEVVSKGIIG